MVGLRMGSPLLPLVPLPFTRVLFLQADHKPVQGTEFAGPWAGGQLLHEVHFFQPPPLSCLMPQAIPSPPNIACDLSGGNVSPSSMAGFSR